MTEETEGTVNAPAKGTMLARALEFALDVDRLRAWEDVLERRRAAPDADNATLARDLIATTAWKGTALGAATGLVANPWAAVPAAMLDAGAMLRLQVELAMRIALLYEPELRTRTEPPYELLIPIMGSRIFAEVARETAIRAGMGVSRAAVRRYLRKDALKQMQRLALRYLGLKVTQGAVITKTLPLIGSAIGAAWNHVEARVVGGRVVDYFEGRALG